MYYCIRSRQSVNPQLEVGILIQSSGIMRDILSYSVETIRKLSICIEDSHIKCQNERKSVIILERDNL